MHKNKHTNIPISLCFFTWSSQHQRRFYKRFFLWSAFEKVGFEAFCLFMLRRLNLFQYPCDFRHFGSYTLPISPLWMTSRFSDSLDRLDKWAWIKQCRPEYSYTYIWSPYALLTLHAVFHCISIYFLFVFFLNKTIYFFLHHWLFGVNVSKVVSKRFNIVAF